MEGNVPDFVQFVHRALCLTWGVAEELGEAPFTGCSRQHRERSIPIGINQRGARRNVGHSASSITDHHHEAIVALARLTTLTSHNLPRHPG